MRRTARLPLAELAEPRLQIPTQVQCCHSRTCIANQTTAHHSSHAALQQAIHAGPFLAAADAHGAGVLLLLENIKCRQAGAIYEQVSASTKAGTGHVCCTCWGAPRP